MLKNYLKISLRKITRQKSIFFITVGGLAMGIAAAIFIISFISNEWSYDRFNEKHENIYRIFTGNIGDADSWVGTPAPLGPALKSSLPEVTNFTRMKLAESFVSANNKGFHEKKILNADPSLFSIFTFPLVQGDRNNLLSDPNSVVISQSAVKKYFGNTNPLGQTITLNDKEEYHVTGVFADIPENSHLQFNMVFQFEKAYKNSLQSWNMYNYSTYLLTKPDIDKALLLDKLRNTIVQTEGQERELTRFNLQQLTDIHFQYIRGNYEPVYDMKYIYILGSIAFFLLLLASINYINIATAFAPTRAKEVGIKKVVGSNRYRVILQLLTESFFHLIIAIVVAVLLFIGSVPLMSNVLGENISINLLSTPVLVSLLGIFLVVGVLSGIYPALLIANYKPALILKGVTPGKKKSVLRNVLVGFQFGIAVFFIIGTLTSLRQLNLLKNKDLGIAKDLIVNVSLPSKNIQKKSREIKNEFLKHSNILNASVNTFQMGNVNWHQSVYWEGQTDEDQTAMYIIAGDKDFFATYDVPFIQGKDFATNFESDSTYGFKICRKNLSLE